MDEAWQQLIELGVPDGPPHRRDPAAFSDGAARSALAALDLARLDPARSEALLAWLRAWRHHWPDRWAGALGSLGDRAIEQLERGTIEPNRYLKLRRIAIAHLAGLI